MPEANPLSTNQNLMTLLDIDIGRIWLFIGHSLSHDAKNCQPSPKKPSLKSIKNGIFGEGSQILTNKKKCSLDVLNFDLLKFVVLPRKYQHSYWSTTQLFSDIFAVCRYNLLAKHAKKSKIIYVIRDPKHAALELYNAFYIKHMSKYQFRRRPFQLYNNS